MAVQVLIRRKIMETKAKEVVPLIVKLRSLATIQPGYICGETLNCIDPPGHIEYLVRSTWHSVEDWKKWLQSKKKVAINEQTDQYGIKGIPTLMFFKGGKLVDKLTGLVPMSNIEDAIMKCLSDSEPAEPVIT